MTTNVPIICPRPFSDEGEGKMFRRIARAFKNRSPRDLPIFLFYNFKYYMKTLSVSEIKSRKKEEEFDKNFGVETSKIREIGSLDVPIEFARLSVRYEPTSVEFFTKMIEALDIKFNRYVFVDYGSGKGRVLLLASRYNFKNIIGVELSKELHQISKKNILQYKDSKQRCPRIKPICCNAIDFIPPDEPLICFFYNPFSESVLREVVNRLEQSIEKNYRPVYILYLDPVYRRVFEQSDIWELGFHNKNMLIYRTSKQANNEPSLLSLA